MNNLNQYIILFDNLPWHTIISLLIEVVKGLSILTIGWLLANFVYNKLVKIALTYPSIDNTIGRFLASVLKWFILLFTGITILNMLGIQATSIIAVLGAATLAIGLALQNTLQDLAAGVLLVLFRPYKLGQYVDIGGSSGTVVEINLFITELATFDNVQVTMPNGRAWGAVIHNYSHYPKRRVDIDVGISYEDNIDTAINSIRKAISADTRIDSTPEPWIKVKKLGESSVDIGLRVWCDNAECWNLRFDLLKSIKQQFDADGITIPYPQQVVYFTHTPTTSESSYKQNQVL